MTHFLIFIVLSKFHNINRIYYLLGFRNWNANSNWHWSYCLRINSRGDVCCQETAHELSLVKLSKLEKNCLPKRTESHPAKKGYLSEVITILQAKNWKKNCLVQPISVVLRCISVTTVHSEIFRTMVNLK